jgi:hypothetical protein
MNAAFELSQLADAIAAARTRSQSRSIQEPLQALRGVCEEFGRAWSGSNIGYHATTYYRDFRAKPPHVQFSSEWGLMDRWPTHEPDRGWEMMDYKAVSDEILARAGKDIVKAAEAELAPIQKAFVSLRESVISALSVFVGKKPDSFVKRQLQAIELITIPGVHEIAQTFTPSRVWSRDSLALTQGVRAAPHQDLSALTLYADAIESGLDQLEKATRIAASHVARLTPVASDGAFIDAGNVLDAFAAIGNVLANAKADVLVVDPYMDEKALTEFAHLVPRGTSIRLLADAQGHKPTLAPAAKRWVAQYGSAHPLEVRLSAARSLHDRLIVVDEKEVWVLTQSLNAFAARAPASIVKVDSETATLKIDAYKGLWQGAQPL